MNSRLKTFLATVAVCWVSAAAAQSPLSDMTAIWSNAGTDYKALSMTVQNTLSGAGSNLLYLTEDANNNTFGIDKWANAWWVEKAAIGATPAAGRGYLWVKNTAPSTLIFTDDAGTDFTLGSGGGLTNWEESGTTLRPTTAGFDLGDATNELGDIYMADSKSLILGSAQDLYLTRDAANVLAQRNSTAAQEQRWYGTYTDASNHERISIGHDGLTEAFIKTESAGIGTTRALKFYADSTLMGLLDTTNGNYGFGLTVLDSITVGAGLHNIAIGESAGTALLTGDNNVAIGAFALDALTNVGANVAIGHQALTDAAGADSTVAIGYRAGYTVNVGDDNVFVGYQSGDNVTNGASNTYIGWASGGNSSSGNFNATLGYNSGANIGTGSYNIAIGENTSLSAANASNEIIIGSNSSNRVPFIAGEMSPQSDTDISGEDITITGTSANAAASTNLNAGDLILQGGVAATTGAGVGGDLILRGGAGGSAGTDGVVSITGKAAHPFGGALTLNAGVVTATDSYHEITSQSGPNDDLDTINGGTDGMILVLHATSGDTITVKDGTGNIKTATDFAMNAIEDSIMLIYSGAQSSWIEISRSDNG